MMIKQYFTITFAYIYANGWQLWQFLTKLKPYYVYTEHIYCVGKRKQLVKISVGEGSILNDTWKDVKVFYDTA